MYISSSCSLLLIFRFSFEIKKKLNQSFLRKFCLLFWDAYLNGCVLKWEITVDIFIPLKLTGGQQQYYNSKLKSVGPSFEKAIVRKKACDCFAEDDTYSLTTETCNI